LIYFIETIKLKRKSSPKIIKRAASSINEIPSEPLRPLLLLLENESEKPVDPLINIAANFLRPKSSPINKQFPIQHRINPLLNMLDGRPGSSTNTIRSPHYQQQQTSLESSSVNSLTSIPTTGPRKLIQGKFITTHKAADLDALYRMALQNQTAYKSVEQTRIDQRKLYDKEFASQHRALKGSMRSAGTVN